VNGAVLLDTNIVSYLAKGDTRAERYRGDLNGRRLCVSFITVAELRLWGRIRKWSQGRIESMEQTLRSYVVIPYDDAVATAWAELAAAAIHGGRDRSDRMDWWIAACAIRHGLPLVTHDSRDFDGIEGLTVITHPDPA